MTNSDLKSYTKTRHFLIEWAKAEALGPFFEHAKNVCSALSIFRGNVGEIYISVTGPYDPNCELDINTFDEVLDDHRKNITVLKEFFRKPRPEKTFVGEWIKYK